MTPEEYLSRRASNLNLTEGERSRIARMHSSLREELRERLPLEDDFLTGSYPRNTIIRPGEDQKLDVDFFLAFGNEKYGEYELPMLLEMVRAALDDIKRDSEEIVNLLDQNRSIGVEYKNGFQIDVVPSIELSKGVMYKIFDKRTAQAIESNPKIHGALLSEANSATEHGSTRRLVPIIKLLKAWKRSYCDYVKSFHLELLALEVLKDRPIESYSLGLSKFFSGSSTLVSAGNMADPANEDNLVDAYLDENGKRSELLDLLSEQSEMAMDAIGLEAEGRNEAAIQLWETILGNPSIENGLSVNANPTVITTPPKQHGYVRSNS